LAGRPGSAPPGTPQWGAAWKKAVKDNYLSAILPSTMGSCYSYRDCYLDLDPTYKDRFGRRWCGWLRLSRKRAEDVAVPDRPARRNRAADGPRQIVKLPRTGHFNIVPYQTTRTCGGAITGTDPKTSALNRYLQSWDVHNLFVTGATNFPQNAGCNPTDTIGALTYWSLDAIHQQYLKNPGPLVHV
jgi:gluconate 2-dehydrogenase alpha chain